MAGSTTTQFRVGNADGAPAPIDQTAQQREVDDEFELVNPWFTSFLDALGRPKSMPGLNQKTEWVEADLWKDTLTLSSTTGLAATDGTTLTLNAADAYRVQPGTVLLIDSEMVLVTARASTTTLTIIRDYAGTTAATHATASIAYIAGIARQEGSDSPYRANTIKTFPYNYYQQFEATFEITKPAETLREYGGMSKLEQLRQEQTEDLKANLELATIHGVRFAGTSTTEPAQMGGVYDFVAAANGSYVAALSSAALTEANLNTMLRGIYANVDERKMAKDLFVGPFLRQKVDSFYENRVRTTVGERTGGSMVDRIQSSIGPIDIHLSRRMKPDQVLLINTDLIDVGHWPGFNWLEIELARAGFYRRYARGGSFTLRVHNFQTMGKLTGVSTSS